MEFRKCGLTDLDGNPVPLPLGYKFAPSDEELVVFFLRKKANSLPLPSNVIPNITNVFLSPWDLPGKLEDERYFFSPRTRNSSCIINTRCGYWKHQVDEDMQIVADGTNSVIGIKKSWVFFTEESIETQWMMDQFCLVRAFDASLTKKKVVEVGKWNAYRVYEEVEEDTYNEEDGFFLSRSNESSVDEYSSNLDQEANSPEINSGCRFSVMVE